MPNCRDNRVYLLLVTLVLLAALAVRLGLVWSAATVTRDAASQYLPVAQAWQLGVATKAFAGGIPPLYPMLTGYLARLAGNVELAGRIVSLVGGMLVLLFMFLLAYRLAGRWTACVALALVSFHPYLCQFAADIGPDSLGAGLLAGVVYGVCACLLTFRFWNVLLTAAMLGALALTRPEGFAYGPLVLFVLLAWPVRQRYSWRRVAHVAALVLILAGLCVPRLISVHSRTGVWALDTRQRTWSARIWTALRSGEPEYGQWRIWSRGGLAAVGGTVEATVASFGPAGLIFGIYGLAAAGRLRQRRVAWVIVLFVLYGYALILVGNRISKRYLLGPAALWQVWTAIGIVLLFLRVRRHQPTASAVVASLAPSVSGGRLGQEHPRTQRERGTQRRVGSAHHTGAMGCHGQLACPCTGGQAASGTQRRLGSARHTGFSTRSLRGLPVAAGLVIAALQLPWVPQRLHIDGLAERRMGEWIAANLPAGTRIMAMDPVAIWYGRAVKVNPPTFKPSRLTPAALAMLARQVKAELILVDARGPAWCPDVWPRLQKGQWQYGRILHGLSQRKHTLYLLDVSRGDQAAQDLLPRKRGRTHPPRHAAVAAAASQPASSRPAGKPPAARGKAGRPAVSRAANGGY